MKLFKSLVFLLLFAVIIILAHIFAGKTESNTIKIGGLFPLTGGLASYGEPARNIAAIAIEDINSSGGVNGRDIELVSEDHQCDPKIALSAFEKLSGSDNIHIFTSVACTGTVSSIEPELSSKQAVLLGTVTSGNKLTGISPDFFRNWASDGQEAKMLAERAKQIGYKNIAVIYEETDYAKGLKISFEDYLKDSGIKIGSESFASGSTDVRTQLTKLQALKPDLVFVSVQTVTSGELVLKQMEQLGFKPAALFVNDNILKSSALLTAHTSLLENAIGGDYVFTASDDLKKVLAEYKARYDSDCPQVNICAAEYDAIKMLAEAIRKNGATAQGVKDYLKTATYHGVSGNVSFDQNNDRSNAGYSLFVVKVGKAQMIR